MRSKMLIVITAVVFAATVGVTGALAGEIKGVVSYDGPVPKLRPISMDSDPICLKKHDSPVVPPVLVLGDNQTLGNVFVYIKSGLPSKTYPVPEDPVSLDQRGCQYHPHVLGVRAGQTVRILNSDGTLHNVHALSKVNPEFNIAMPKFRKEIKKVFEKPEFMFPLKCDVHPWMGAWMSVMEHPFFDTTKKDGVFSIKGLPAGTYEVGLWHEKLGERVETVTLAGDETKELNVTLSRPAKK